MIHAFLFVTANNRDRSAHGPVFKAHMRRINEAAGTKITVYHSFHDEVNVYRQHWWKCDGPCVRRRPFYGMVKRAMNRAPGPNDTWYAEHQRNCGGTFHKIKEPEGFQDKKKTKKSKKSDSNAPRANGKKTAAKPKAEPGTNSKASGAKKNKPPSGSSKNPAYHPHSVLSMLNDKHESRVKRPAPSNTSTAGNHPKSENPPPSKKPKPEPPPLFQRFPGLFSKSENRSASSLPSVRSSNAAVLGGTFYTPKVYTPSKKPFVKREKSLSNKNSSTSSASSTATASRSTRGIVDRVSEPRTSSSKTPISQPSISDMFSRQANVKAENHASSSSSATDSAPFKRTFSGSGVAKREATVTCPVCSSKVVQSYINPHLDSCVRNVKT